MRPFLLVLSFLPLVYSSWLPGLGGCPSPGTQCTCSIPCASYLGMSGGFGPTGGAGYAGAGAYATGARGGGAGYAVPPYRSKRERGGPLPPAGELEEAVEEESVSESPFLRRAHGSKTERRDEDLVGVSQDHLCNSPTLRRVLKANIVDSADQSRHLIQKALKQELRHDFVVICTPNPFGFTATKDTEYCSVSSVVHSCYVFAF